MTFKTTISVLAVVLGVSGAATAQPIHGNPQKAAYASSAEWPTVSGDCWWLAPGSGGLPGIPSHVGHMTLTTPVGAETDGTPITIRFAITLFNAAGSVRGIAGNRVKSWTLDNGATLPLQGDPTGVRTWTGSAVIDTASTPARGWYKVRMEFLTKLLNGDFGYTYTTVSFYSMRDPLAADTGWLNITSAQCTIFDASIGFERWGQQITEFQQVLPLLGPVSPELPWRIQSALYTYGATGPLPEGIFEMRLDPDFHNGNPGTLLDRVVGNKIARIYSLPLNIPDGPHKLMYQWIRPDPAGTRTLVSNLVYNITVGPGGVAQPPDKIASQTPPTTQPPPPPSGHTSTPPPTGHPHD